MALTVCGIVQLKMTDRAACDCYQARFFDAFRDSMGGCCQRMKVRRSLEGEWDCDKLVSMSLPDEAAFYIWANSPEYLEIPKRRKAGAQGIVLAKEFAPAA